MILRYLDISSTDPAYNLALEQYLFEHLPLGQNCFLLWQNDSAVIIGKHQNTLAQINEPFVHAHGIQVVRRLSGGGAVYHDLGNLNFSFITDNRGDSGIRFCDFCLPILELLKKLGIQGELTGRNDMTVDGRKFSGNAQYIHAGRILHHGTIMFDSDLTTMECALHVDPSKIQAKGISSVRSRVTNLRPFLSSDLTLSQFRTRLLDHVLCTASGHIQPILLTPRDQEAIQLICNSRYRTWAWNYGQSPPCTVVKQKRFDSCGSIELYLVIEQGIITQATFRGDFFGVEDPQHIANLLIGQRAEAGAYQRALKNIDVSAYFSGLTSSELLSMLV